MDNELVQWLRQDILWEKFDKVDGAGDASYLPAVSLKGFIEGEIQTILDTQGREIVSNQWILFNGTIDPIGPQDRLTLPDGTKPPILKVIPCYDDLGSIDHWEVCL